ncbi:MAG: threonine synthase [Verrucomicrobia bacterium]|nr:threonine synthase [Verrucomicrobiota bacterium]
MLGNLYAEQIRRTGIPIRVLGATSGDTGAAAIHGLLGQPGVQIFILYPNGKVSPLQERQMACTGAENVFAIAIEGSFDDAQTAIKDVFGDLAFRNQYHLSAVNSINLARILAQCVYYAFGWLQLPERLRYQVNFVVPTGNFGNVLAGWLMHKMGMPVAGFRVATNRNDILYRLFSSGVYACGTVSPSCAPSMDIQIASNFERFLYFHEGCNASQVRHIMQTFRQTGNYTFPKFERDAFSASRADDADIERNIQWVFQKYGYIADPHTACGFQDLPGGGINVVLATAHPAKFPETIHKAIGKHPKHPALEALQDLPLSRHQMAPTPEAIKQFIERSS